MSHTAITYRVPWTRTVVPGDHHVSVKLTYDGDRVTTWNGTIAIAGALQRQLQQALHDTKVGAPAPGARLVAAAPGAAGRWRCSPARAGAILAPPPHPAGADAGRLRSGPDPIEVADPADRSLGRSRVNSGSGPPIETRSGRPPTGRRPRGGHEEIGRRAC